MKFYRIHDINLDKVQLVPRHDLEADGSFIAFDIVSDIDTSGLLGEVFSRLTIIKYFNGVVLLQVKCKYSAKDKRHHTVETYGICTKEESDTLEELYCKAMDLPTSYLMPASIGGEKYTAIMKKCYSFC